MPTKHKYIKKELGHFLPYTTKQVILELTPFSTMPHNFSIFHAMHCSIGEKPEKARGGANVKIRARCGEWREIALHRNKHLTFTHLMGERKDGSADPLFTFCQPLSVLFRHALLVSFFAMHY